MTSGLRSLDFNHAATHGGSTSTTTSFTDTNLTPGTAYRYHVRARDAAGNTSAFSAAATIMTTGGTGGCSAALTLQNGWGNGSSCNPTR